MKRLSWALVALLAFATYVIISERNSAVRTTSFASKDPTGYQLLYELLEKYGYSVELSRSARLNAPADSILITSQFQPEDLDDVEFSSEEISLSKEIQGWVKNGGILVQLADSDLDSKIEGSAIIKHVTDPKVRTYTLPGKPYMSSSWSGLPVEPVFTIKNWKNATVGWVPLGKGGVVVLAESAIYNNSNISKLDTAPFVLEIFGRIAGSDQKLIFLESLETGIEQKTIWEALGPWGEMFFWQACLVLLAWGWSQSKALGHPRLDRLSELGNQGTIIASGHLMKRAKLRTLAKKLHSDHLERRSRALLPRSQQNSDSWMESVPEMVQSAWSNLKSKVPSGIDKPEDWQLLYKVHQDAEWQKRHRRR